MLSSNGWLKRVCPLCQDRNAERTLEMRSETRAEDLTFDQLRESFIGLRHQQVFFSYWRCLRCELLYCPEYFTETQLGILYSEMPDNFMGEKESVVSRTQLGYVKWLSRRTSNVTSYLEVGPDVGLATEQIAKKYKIAQGYLVEPNKAVHAALENSAVNFKEFAIVSAISELKSSISVDLILAIHVLDHMLDPKSLLGEILGLAHNQTQVVIVTHDESSLLRRAMKAAWPPFCLQHPQLFSKNSLRKILDNSGWDFEFHNKTINWQSLSHFVAKGARVAGIPDGWSRFLPQIEVPLPLGNQIIIASPKVLDT